MRYMRSMKVKKTVNNIVQQLFVRITHFRFKAGALKRDGFALVPKPQLWDGTLLLCVEVRNVSKLILIAL